MFFETKNVVSLCDILKMKEKVSINKIKKQ